MNEVHPSPIRAGAVGPSELERAFRLVALDWDGTAVTSRSEDASRVGGLLGRLLVAGARVAIVTGTKLENVARQLLPHVAPDSRRHLLVAANRGSEVFAFDRQGESLSIWRREATAEEEQLLDAVVEEVRARLERLTSLSFVVVYDRLNRRKIDLIPLPEWADPPKSAIAALLAATEARLRGAGLRGGLREAFELTEHVARELGLTGARVTSDVKHIEVGLTDKSDSIAFLLREIAGPLRIQPADVLLVGDEFGPIGGFEGSDHRMLGVPEVRGAVVVSVGSEPGGAPEGVIHLGGGPPCFCALLEQQLDYEARLGSFAPPRDATWVVEEAGFDLAREHEIESLLAIANGYLGSRGSIAEGTSVSRPATYLAGAFEASADRTQVPELVIAPDWGRLRFVLEGEPLTVESGMVRDHRRSLDLRRGVLLREGIGTSPAGYAVQLRTLHAASLEQRHLLLEGVEMVALNFTGSVRMDGILSGGVKSASGASHWASFEATANDHELLLMGRTRADLDAILSSSMQLRGPEGQAPVCERQTGDTWASERCQLTLCLGDTTELHRTVTLHTSRDTADPLSAERALRSELAGTSMEELLGRHQRAWAERWRRANVEIDGAPKLERALRFALYHLIASANPDDPRSSIGARALTGEAYRGHVFWDTEIFMLPFFTHCFPEAARSMLMYRHRTIEGARRKAKKMGYEGALYAWESADTGDETTPSILITPFGDILRVLSGEQEHHISADVAHAVRAYARATADEAFLEREGLDILVDTARFWASRVRLDDAGAHIDGVIGPDEYHENVNDNAFSNWMARANLRYAADMVERYRAARPDLDVRADEVARWRYVARQLVLGQDPLTGLIEQFAGFHRLAYVDLAAFTPRTAPIDALLGRERTQASQVVKQSDVVQLVALLWDELSDDARRANYLYYEPRTSHGSSLSPGIHALVAARLGLSDTAMRYLEQTADIDLDNNMGNSAGGVHAAAMGSLWQAIVMGVAGVRPAPEDEATLVIEPRLLPSFRHLGFPFFWRGAWLDVHIEAPMLEVAVSGDRGARVRTGSHPMDARVLSPGRRYVARFAGTGYGRLEDS